MMDHIHFVTGRLAEQALRDTVRPLAAEVGFDYSIDVLPITVAALMTDKWMARHLHVPPEATRVLFPGYCGTNDVSLLAPLCGDAVIEFGPRDLRALPDYFGKQGNIEYGDYDIGIIAEINHAPRLPLAEVISQARALRDAGADVIDVGCEPGDVWRGVADCVKALKDEGFRISIDSFQPTEIELAVRAGAELVLSVNSSNRHAAPDWGCEVVVIPDDIPALGGLDETVEQLNRANVRLRIDPILEPIGCGFANSLARYHEIRRRYPAAEMMMGIGNLTELTDADSAAINVMLLGICQELKIRSVLTTQVINWARSSVRECDIARRLVYHAVRHGIPPKNIEPALVLLRDPRLRDFPTAHFEQLARQIKDANYRLFAQHDGLHIVSTNLHLQDTDPFALFQQLLDTQPANLDSSHAFYLGFELSKALTAWQLGKQYEQDESLDWGFLTVAEKHHRLPRGGAQ